MSNETELLIKIAARLEVLIDVVFTLSDKSIFCMESKGIDSFEAIDVMVRNREECIKVSLNENIPP